MTELEPEMLFILLFHNGVDHMLQYESYLSEWVSEWVSEWLMFYATSAIFQLYHDQNK